jgi:O-antigen ligase
MPVIPAGRLPGGRGRPRTRRQLLTAAVVLTIALLGALVVGVQLGQAALSSDAADAGGFLVIALGLFLAVGFAVTRNAAVGMVVWMSALIVARLVPGGGLLAVDRLAFLARVGAWMLELSNGKRKIGRLGLTEFLMLCFIILNIASAVIPHTLPAIGEDGKARPLLDMIMSGAFLPFAGFVLARQILTDERSVRAFLWFLTIFGLYLALTNVVWVLGLKGLVFPQDILDPSNPVHIERGRGIFLNAAVTGYALLVGLIAAMHLARQPLQRWRPLLLIFAALMVVGIGLTQTRSAWLAAALVLVFSAVVMKGFRRPYVLIILAILALVAVNWQQFSSSDREQGGVASQNEAEDRLNAAATAIWAIKEEPYFGWGLGTFPAVNSIHHKAWGDTPWIRGYGIFPHDTQLGIGAELGLIGLGLWLVIIGSMLFTSRRAWKALPRSGLTGRGLVASFWAVAIAYAVTASLIEMRIFTFANAVFFVFGGMCAGLADRHIAAEAAAEAQAEGLHPEDPHGSTLPNAPLRA